MKSRIELESSYKFKIDKSRTDLSQEKFEKLAKSFEESFSTKAILVTEHLLPLFYSDYSKDYLPFMPIGTGTRFVLIL
jgi:hypothetical protein